MAKQSRILKQLYDVRPTKSDGSLDMEKITGSDRIIRIERKKQGIKAKSRKNTCDVQKNWTHSSHRIRPTRIQEFKYAKKKEDEIHSESFQPNIIHLGRIMPKDFISISRIATKDIFTSRTKSEDKENNQNQEFVHSSDNFFEQPIETKKEALNKNFFDSEIANSTEYILDNFEKKKERKKRKRIAKKRNICISNLPRYYFLQHSGSFIAAILIFSLILPFFSFIQKGSETRNLLHNTGENVLGEFAQAKENLAKGNFEGASSNLEKSYEIIKSANIEVSRLGGDFSEILRFFPGISKVATANYLLSSGENAVLAGKSLTDSLKSLANIENPLNEGNSMSLTDLFLHLRDGVAEANQNLILANENIQKANIDDLPKKIQPKFIEVKNKLPGILSSLQSFSDDSSIFLDILGYNGPRKFLFLFQNNQEMRATGGFIGSYGILDISNGRIRKLFVDDIYNPDGQLTARVIPPEPIQKMSAVWTMHDANWFPDFPTSAEKIAWFYEKTGGPTVDGVITMTPNVIEKMLSVTGPIEMPEYDTTVSENDFVEKTQQEVEVDYDREENKPKKFIADLMPKILDQLLNTKDAKMMLRSTNILCSALEEKHILLYSKNFNIQKIISQQGWSGEILNTKKDYLSVINTNINGYKTDGIIDEKISHNISINEDGSITDDVAITRKHKGGNEKYDWWNKVNGDWVRVYVPEGSRLVEASGQTREFVTPPLDYAALHFKKDPKLAEQEQDMIIDEESGTRIYTENHKTVFANWIYVSPGETVELNYKYILPFRISFDELHHPADTFSILYQKQSGSNGSSLESNISIPENYQLIWKYPDTVKKNNKELIFETMLDTDKFIGFTATRKP